MRLNHIWHQKKKHRVRKEWKYYLIVYDLKERYNYTNNDIADILNSAFPKKGHKIYDASNIKYHYTQATQLIDKGNYREFLNY